MITDRLKCTTRCQFKSTEGKKIVDTKSITFNAPELGTFYSYIEFFFRCSTPWLSRWSMFLTQTVMFPLSLFAAAVLYGFPIFLPKFLHTIVRNK